MEGKIAALERAEHEAWTEIEPNAAALEKSFIFRQGFRLGAAFAWVDCAQTITNGLTPKVAANDPAAPLPPAA